MGASLMTLHLRADALPAVQGMLRDSEPVRDSGCGWVRVLMEPQANSWQPPRIVRKIPGVSILFDWVDDDAFSLTLYQDGKKRARLGWEEQAEHLARFAAVCPEDPSLIGKLKALPKCATPEEGCALLEESLGLILYDMPEMEPRLCVKSEETYERVMARERSLKSRPNQYRLAAADEREWPAELKLRQKLAAQEGAEGWTSAPGLLRSLEPAPGKPGYCMAMRERLVGTPDVVKMTPEGGFEIQKGSGHAEYALSLYDGRGLARSYAPLPGVGKVLYFTESFGAVCACYHEREGVGLRFLCCVRDTGVELWRFAPELSPDDYLQFAGVRANGEITVYRDNLVSDPVIWQIDAEDGRILRTRTIPGARLLQAFRWYPEAEAYVYYDAARNAEILMNGELCETRSFPLGEKPLHLAYASLCAGRCLWDTGPWRWRGMDLTTGEIREIRPEIPAYLHAVLPDGTMVGLHTREQALVVTDKTGRVISRNRVKRTIWRLFSDGGDVYVWEDDKPQMSAALRETRPALWKLVQSKERRKA